MPRRRGHPAIAKGSIYPAPVLAVAWRRRPGGFLGRTLQGPQHRIAHGARADEPAAVMQDVARAHAGGKRVADGAFQQIGGLGFAERQAEGQGEAQDRPPRIGDPLHRKCFQ